MRHSSPRSLRYETNNTKKLVRETIKRDLHIHTAVLLNKLTQEGRMKGTTKKYDKKANTNHVSAVFERIFA